MKDIIIAGVPASLVIVSLVQVAKYLGMNRKFAPLLSVALGIAVMVSVQVVRAVPWLQAWWEAIGAGLMLGLSACGLYSGGKAMLVSKLAGSGNLKETSDGAVIDATPVEPEPITASARVVEPPAQIGPGGRVQ
jgi:hypothetical protein